MKPLALLLVLLPPAWQASAGDIDHDEALELSNAGVILPLQRLIDSAVQRHPGSRLLEAELDEDDGHYRYEVELLGRDGQVRELEFDAASGQLLADQIDD